MRFPYFLNRWLLCIGAWLRPDIRWTLPATGESAGKRVCLTLDDGPGAQYMPQVLQVLREEGVCATFFVLGDRCRLFPDVLRQAAREGHGLALHGDCRLEFTHRQSAPLIERLAANRAALEDALGEDRRLHSALQPPRDLHRLSPEQNGPLTCHKHETSHR